MNSLVKSTIFVFHLLCEESYQYVVVLFFIFVIADNLIYSIAKSLPQEIDAAHQQRWNAVLVNQYLCDLREAKKQGRKERKHKEAQAVLAAATAAAAASSRVSSFRKDSLDESGQPEVLYTCSLNNNSLS